MVNKTRILIVDDDNNIAELISLYMTKECYETLIVNDGESVLPVMEGFDCNADDPGSGPVPGRLRHSR